MALSDLYSHQTGVALRKTPKKLSRRSMLFLKGLTHKLPGAICATKISAEMQQPEKEENQEQWKQTFRFQLWERFVLINIALIKLARTIHPSCTSSVSPRHPFELQLPPSSQGCLICLPSLPEFVFLLLWFSRCRYKQELNSPAWLRICLLWWELPVPSVRPEPGPPNTNNPNHGLPSP